MGTLQVIVGGVLMAVGGFIIVMNWGVVVQWLWKRKHSSWIPIVGGGLAAAGSAIVPHSTLNGLWWVPLLVDWGCLPGVTYAIVFNMWRSFTQRSNDMK
jgi:hypothetical protein